LLAPELVDQPIDRDDAIAVQEQQRQQRTRLRGRKRDWMSLDDRFHRAEDAKFGQGTDDRRSLPAL
jgi:hypothetical protein